MWKKRRKDVKELEQSQGGQALVEFALLLPILLLLLLVPIDFFRVINTKMILNTAASESIAKLDYAELTQGNLDEKIRKIVEEDFGDKLDRNKVVILHLAEKDSEEQDYIYYVYSSDLAEDHPDDVQAQFEQRPSKYKYKEIELQISYNIEPITFWGSLFIGSSMDVTTPLYRKNIYVLEHGP